MATWRITAPLALAALSACTSLPEDLGRSDVDALVAERGRPVEAGDAASLVASLTAEPLTAEAAVRVALLNNPQLQATYAELGFAAADMYEAGRIRNPVFSAAFLATDRSGERDQLTFGLVTTFTDLLTLRARKRLATAEFAAVKYVIGARVLEIVADTESAYYRFIGAKQVSALRARVARAGALSLALAERYHAAGNLTPRDLALEQAAASEAKLAALESDAEADGARTRLATILGLRAGDDWDTSAQLPAPLEEEDVLADLLVLAHKSRLDLAAAHARADIEADRLGVTNWTRWLGRLNVGAERERETGGGHLTGPTVDWEVPVFTQHRDALMRVDAGLEIAIAEVERLSLAVDNDVHLAYAVTENARARVTEYRDRLIPARVAAVQRAQEEENFMLIGIFELLAAKRREYEAYQGYLETVRDYWLARAALTRAVGNTLPGNADVGYQRIDIDALIQSRSHENHSSHDLEATTGPEREHGGRHDPNRGAR